MKTARTLNFRAGGALSALLLAAAMAQAEPIVLKGSNTFGEELAPALIDRYRQSHPEARVQLQARDSASGIEALLAGECDVAASSRPLSEDEKRLARSRGITLNDYVIGFYGVAVIVNQANPIGALSDEQVAAIFSGAITNWKQLGGEDAPIQIYGRDPSSGTYLGFQELALQNKPYSAATKLLTSYSDIVTAVAGQRTAIGYSSMNLAGQNGIRTVRINQVPPTTTEVNEGSYPFSRTLRLYTDQKRESTAVKDFIRFINSRAGQSVLNEHGFVRVYEPRLWSPEM